jgi:hypothetical protein
MTTKKPLEEPGVEEVTPRRRLSAWYTKAG